MGQYGSNDEAAGAGVKSEQDALLPPGATVPVVDSNDKKSIAISVLTLVLSIPALIGA